MQTLFRSKNFYTAEILSEIQDEEKRTFIKNSLQRYIFINGSFKAYRTRPSNIDQTVKEIRSSEADMANLDQVFDIDQGFHIASGYFVIGGESGQSSSPTKNVPIVWLLSNNHTNQTPTLSFSPQNDVYFLVDPHDALKLAQITSTPARKLSGSESDLGRVLNDFLTGNFGLVNTLYNEDDLTILARKFGVEFVFSQYQFIEKDWVNLNCGPENKNNTACDQAVNLNALIDLFHARRANISKELLLPVLHEMKRQNIGLRTKQPFEQVIQMMKSIELDLIVEVTPKSILLNDGDSVEKGRLRRALKGAISQLNQE